MRKPGQITAMISTTALDMPEHRKAVVEACLSQGVFPIGMERHPTRDAAGVQACLEMVNSADIYIGIYAWRYGWVPDFDNPDNISIAEMEFNRAVERNASGGLKGILIFVMHEDHPIRPADFETNDIAQKKLTAFKKRALTGQTRWMFTSTEELRGQVIHALAEHRRVLDSPACCPSELSATRNRVVRAFVSSTFNSLGQQAKATKDDGRYEEAELLYRQSLIDSERVLGPEHPTTIAALIGLADIQMTRGRHDLAEPLYRRCIETSERAFGPDCLATVASLNALAEIHKLRGDAASADALSRRALAIRAGSFNPDSVNQYDKRGTFDSTHIVEQDAVDCTLYAPPEASSGATVLVQVYVHLPTCSDEARSMAQEFDSDSRRRGFSSLGTMVSRGTAFTFELKVPGLFVEPAMQKLVWQGRTEYVQYPVRVPEGHPPTDILGKLLVSQASIPIGQILFKLRVVVASSDQGRSPMPSGTATRYNLAFISYASDDRPEVLRRVQMLPAVGIRYFQDVLDLDPGDRWAQELFRHIDESDVMFLFWSSAARASEWVAKEWRYGLEKKGDSFIRPVVIEGPPPPEAPPELKHLHFADRVLYFIKGSE